MLSDCSNPTTFSEFILRAKDRGRVILRSQATTQSPAARHSVVLIGFLVNLTTNLTEKLNTETILPLLISKCS